MKNAIANILTVLVLSAGMLTTVEPVDAQTTWIRCKYIPTGEIQMFPNYCPQDWVRV